MPRNGLRSKTKQSYVRLVIFSHVQTRLVRNSVNQALVDSDPLLW